MAVIAAAARLAEGGGGERGKRVGIRRIVESTTGDTTIIPQVQSRLCTDVNMFYVATGVATSAHPVPLEKD